MKVPFSKLSGCGNDFILIDNRDQKLSAAPITMFKQLCHRQNGIGADGIIWLEHTQQNTASIRLFNSDGSEAESCGNAFRCLLTYLRGQNPQQAAYTVQTPFTTIRGAWENSLIRLEFPDPTDIQWNLSLQVEGQTFFCHYLNTSVPHVVVFVDSLDTTDVAQLGRALRHHPHFAHQGTNVNFASITHTGLPAQISYRTYERGVEAETLACGTGAIAVALTSSYLYNLTSPLALTTRSGETLHVGFSAASTTTQFHHVFLTGPAELVYEGNIELGKVSHGKN